MEKIRLDNLLKEKGLFESREKAKNAIVNNLIKVNGNIVCDASKKVEVGVEIEILGNPNKYVSRGAKKLEKALEFFNINVKGLVALDIGSSTGGFTDVLLQNGINKVYCVDVGKDQLHQKIRNSEKTVVFEETDFRTLDANIISDVDIIVIDVSFISIETIIKRIKEVYKDKEILVVSLIKPQFECGMEIAKKYKGIIKDKNIHKNIVDRVLNYWKVCGFKIKGVTWSPIKGGDGNIEYLLLTKLTRNEKSNFFNIDNLVEDAFTLLKNN